MSWIWTNDELGLPEGATQEERNAAIAAEYQRMFPQDKSKGLRTDFSDDAVRSRLEKNICGLPRRLSPLQKSAEQ